MSNRKKNKISWGTILSAAAVCELSLIPLAMTKQSEKKNKKDWINQLNKQKEKINELINKMDPNTESNRITELETAKNQIDQALNKKDTTTTELEKVDKEVSNKIEKIINTKKAEDQVLLVKFDSLVNDVDAFKNTLNLQTQANFVNRSQTLIDNIQNFIDPYKNKELLSKADKELIHQKYDEFVKNFNDLKYQASKTELEDKIAKLEKETKNNGSEDNNGSSGNSTTDSTITNKVIEELENLKQDKDKLPDNNNSGNKETENKTTELNNKADKLLALLELEKAYKQNNKNLETLQTSQEIDPLSPSDKAVFDQFYHDAKNACLDNLNDITVEDINKQVKNYQAKVDQKIKDLKTNKQTKTDLSILIEKANELNNKITGDPIFVKDKPRLEVTLNEAKKALESKDKDQMINKKDQLETIYNEIKTKYDQEKTQAVSNLTTDKTDLQDLINKLNSTTDQTQIDELNKLIKEVDQALNDSTKTITDLKDLDKKVDDKIKEISEEKTNSIKESMSQAIANVIKWKDKYITNDNKWANQNEKLDNIINESKNANGGNDITLINKKMNDLKTDFDLIKNEYDSKRNEAINSLKAILGSLNNKAEEIKNNPKYVDQYNQLKTAINSVDEEILNTETIPNIENKKQELKKVLKQVNNDIGASVEDLKNELTNKKNELEALKNNPANNKSEKQYNKIIDSKIAEIEDYLNNTTDFNKEDLNNKINNADKLLDSHVDDLSKYKELSSLETFISASKVKLYETKNHPKLAIAKANFDEKINDIRDYFNKALAWQENNDKSILALLEKTKSALAEANTEFDEIVSQHEDAYNNLNNFIKDNLTTFITSIQNQNQYKTIYDNLVSEKLKAENLLEKGSNEQLIEKFNYLSNELIKAKEQKHQIDLTNAKAALNSSIAMIKDLDDKKVNESLTTKIENLVSHGNSIEQQLSNINDLNVLNDYKKTIDEQVSSINQEYEQYLASLKEESKSLVSESEDLKISNIQIHPMFAQENTNLNNALVALKQVLETNDPVAIKKAKENLNNVYASILEKYEAKRSEDLAKLKTNTNIVDEILTKLSPEDYSQDILVFQDLKSKLEQYQYDPNRNLVDLENLERESNIKIQAIIREKRKKNENYFTTLSNLANLVLMDSSFIPKYEHSESLKIKKEAEKQELKNEILQFKKEYEAINILSTEEENTLANKLNEYLTRIHEFKLSYLREMYLDKKHELTNLIEDYRDNMAYNHDNLINESYENSKDIIELTSQINNIGDVIISETTYIKEITKAKAEIKEILENYSSILYPEPKNDIEIIFNNSINKKIEKLRLFANSPFTDGVYYQGYEFYQRNLGIAKSEIEFIKIRQTLKQESMETFIRLDNETEKTRKYLTENSQYSNLTEWRELDEFVNRNNVYNSAISILEDIKKALGNEYFYEITGYIPSSNNHYSWDKLQECIAILETKTKALRQAIANQA
ncbi:hypothetical protein [[Mycoplasma] anseris]|nr:hypothetical protein [[Mycoplasma] anseris]